MATAPELIDTAPDFLLRPMRAADVPEVVGIEGASYHLGKWRTSSLRLATFESRSAVTRC